MWLRHAKPRQYLEALRNISKSSWLLQSSSFSDTPYKKSKLAPLQERRMIDRFRLWAKGGEGGNGCTSSRRSRHDRHGIPDGGNGGRGGDVILECSSTVWDFSSLQHHINAKRGGHGVSKNKIGSRGDDKVVQVPVGTVIHVVEGEVSSKVEKSSFMALDPWEIPGTLDATMFESAQQSTSTDTSRPEMEERKDVSNGLSSCTGNTEVQSDGTHQATLASSIPSAILSSPSSKKSRARIEHNWKKEGIVWEAVETDGDTSDAERAEENDEIDHTQYNVAELTESGQRIIVARGGEGGSGSASSAKSYKKSDNLMQPSAQMGNAVEASDDDDQDSPTIGLPGSEVLLILELKSIADVGLVGMPNAGKSTILGAISRAKPVVGHYAFTTLRPNLGNLNYDDFSFTIADIPGIIRGAHENRGLGHAFLRHIERTKVLAYVLDLASALDGKKGIPPWEQLRDLILELEYYREGLSDRPSLVVANKIDEAGAEEVYEELKRRVPGVPIFPVCAVLEEGIPELKDGFRALVNGEESQRLRVDDIMLD